MTINFNDVETFMYGNNEVEVFKIGNTVVWEKPVSAPYVQATVLADSQIFNKNADFSNIYRIIVNGTELPSNQWTTTTNETKFYEYLELGSGTGWGLNGIMYITSEGLAGDDELNLEDTDNGEYYEGPLSWDGSSWYFEYSDNTLSLGDSFNLPNYGGSSVLEVVQDSNLSANPIIRITCTGDEVLDNACLFWGNAYVKMEETTAYTVSANSTVKYIFKENATSIPQSMFFGTDISSVSMKGITNIYNSAFASCSSLSSITLPTGLTNISANLFNGCSSLTSIILPSTITSIEANAFSACTSLTNISIPNTVSFIGQNAFYGCSSLTSINLASISVMYGNTLSYCSNLADIYIYSSTLPKNSVNGQWGNDGFGSMVTPSQAAGGSVSGTKTVHFLTTCDISNTNDSTNTDYNGWYRAKAEKNTSVNVNYNSSNTRSVKGLGWTFVKDLT